MRAHGRTQRPRRQPPCPASPDSDAADAALKVLQAAERILLCLFTTEPVPDPASRGCRGGARRAHAPALAAALPIKLAEGATCGRMHQTIQAARVRARGSPLDMNLLAIVRHLRIFEEVHTDARAHVHAHAEVQPEDCAAAQEQQGGGRLQASFANACVRARMQRAGLARARPPWRRPSPPAGARTSPAPHQ